jgi:hypothetical protein
MKTSRIADEDSVPKEIKYIHKNTYILSETVNFVNYTFIKMFQKVS